MDTAARFTILNVEDDDAARYVRTRVLDAHGFAVQEANAGEEALRLALGGGIDLVLLSGLRSLGAWKAGGAPPARGAHRCPGRDAGAGIGELDDGADVYLAEPVEPELLVSTLRAVLSSKRGVRARRSRTAHTFRSLMATWRH